MKNKKTKIYFIHYLYFATGEGTTRVCMSIPHASSIKRAKTKAIFKILNYNGKDRVDKETFDFYYKGLSVYDVTSLKHRERILSLTGNDHLLFNRIKAGTEYFAYEHQCG
jgi:hypothetical protein